MTRLKTQITAALLLVVVLSGVVNPFAGAQSASTNLALAAQPFPTVVPPDTDFDDPFTGDTPEGFDLENFLLIGEEVYPFGDEFLGEPEFDLAGIQQDPLGRYGVATISDSPDHRLLWITDDSSVRHNLIVHKDDPLYSGENGFLQHYDDYKDDLLKMGGAMGVGMTGAATLMGLGLAGCVPSAGVGCAIAIVGAGVSILGGFLGETYFGIFEVGPAMDAMSSLFETIDANRGSQ